MSADRSDLRERFVRAHLSCHATDGAAADAAARVVRRHLLTGLDGLTLHDDTGDPRDEGYMAALEDVRALIVGEST